VPEIGRFCTGVALGLCSFGRFIEYLQEFFRFYKAFARAGSSGIL
jgi:hypothetical protein